MIQFESISLMTLDEQNSEPVLKTGIKPILNS